MSGIAVLLKYFTEEENMPVDMTIFNKTFYFKNVIKPKNNFSWIFPKN
jgi:hypothetical protein